MVLIDTWWNVNANATEILEENITVLIDTWWNVNSVKKDETARVNASFNRYMVECESTTRKVTNGYQICFNRYMVECE